MSFSFVIAGRIVNFHTEVGGNQTTRPVFTEQPIPQEEKPVEQGATQ